MQLINLPLLYRSVIKLNPGYLQPFYTLKSIILQ